jgi:glycosyltransferase involved in cell wall biosynthesis
MVVRPSKGGAFGHVARLGAALREHGHEVAIAGPHAAHRERLDVDVIDIDMGREVTAAADLRAVASLAREIRRYRPDLIHAHGSKGGVVARLARLRSPGTPLVFTSHNFAFTNYFASRLRRGAYRVIEQALAPLATQMLCVCETERRAAMRLTSTRRTRMVHNGIDPMGELGSDPELEALRERGPVLIAVTELQEPKGVPTLIDAMPAVLAANPGATLLVAGGGWMRDGLEAQIDSLGVRDAVRLLGNVEEIGPVYAAGDLFVSPSWSESFPYAILEAMSAGLPIVATGVGGVGEAIEDGVTGRLVAPHSAPELAGAINQALADPDSARRLGEAARDRQRARFNFRSMVEGTLGVYAELGLR